MLYPLSYEGSVAILPAQTNFRAINERQPFMRFAAVTLFATGA